MPYWSFLYLFRHHHGELIAAEQNNDDVDTVKCAKKRRMEENKFDSSSHHHERRGRSCTIEQLEYCALRQFLPFLVPGSKGPTSLIPLTPYSCFATFSLTCSRRQWFKGEVWWVAPNSKARRGVAKQQMSLTAAEWQHFLPGWATLSTLLERLHTVGISPQSCTKCAERLQ